jgi:cytochrome c-type biogenesis protein CcmF
VPGAAGLVALVASLGAGFDLVPSALLLMAGASGAAAVLVAALERRWSAGATTAHLGLVVLVLGLGGSTAAQDVTATLQPGQGVAIGGYRVVNLGASADAGPRGSGGRVVADLVLTDGSRGRALRPQLVAYPERGRLLAETAGRQGLLDDVRVALRSADDDGRVTIEVHVRPLQGAVWLGGLLLVVGGALALLRAGTRSPRDRAATPSG